MWKYELESCTSYFYIYLFPISSVSYALHVFLMVSWGFQHLRFPPQLRLGRLRQRKRPSKSSRVGSKSSGSKPEPPEPEKVMGPKVETEVTWNWRNTAGRTLGEEGWTCWDVVEILILTWGGGFKYFFIFTRIPGEMMKFDLRIIFQLGWFNHQLVKHCHHFGLILWESKKWRTEVVDDLWGKLMGGLFFFGGGGRCKTTFPTHVSIKIQWIRQKNCFFLMCVHI